MEESGLEVGTPTPSCPGGRVKSGGLLDPGGPGQIEKHNGTLCQSVGKGKEKGRRKRGRERRERGRKRKC